ncbi:MAG: hypothetical protein QM690_11850 [Sphingobium sp.]
MRFLVSLIDHGLPLQAAWRRFVAEPDFYRTRITVSLEDRFRAEGLHPGHQSQTADADPRRMGYAAGY